MLVRGCLKLAALLAKNEPQVEGAGAGEVGGTAAGAGVGAGTGAGLGGIAVGVTGSGESGIVFPSAPASCGERCAVSRAATSLRSPPTALKNPAEPVESALLIFSRAGPRFSSSFRSFRPSVSRKLMSLASVTCPAHGCL